MDSDANPQPNPANQQPNSPLPPPIAPVNSAPTISSFDSVATGQTPLQGKSSRKRKLGVPGMVIIGAILLLGGSAAAYFGAIQPNKPENVWQKALSNTAQGYDGLVEYAQKNNDIKGAKAKGSLKLEGAIAGDGSLEAESYEKNSKFKADIGFAGSRYTIEGLSTIPDNTTSPDLYFKVGGIKGVGGLLGLTPYAELGPAIDSLDNQWIFVDHTLFDQIAGSAASSGQPSITSEDAVAIAKAVGEVNRDYLFSTTPDKRVLKVAKQVGREDRDDRSTYHFEVGYDKENLKKYVAALKDKLKDTKLKELIEASGQSYDEALNLETIQKDIDNLKGDETADVWVDMKTKLIRYARFSDKSNKENYLEFGIPFNGGDEVPFSVLFNSADQPKGKMQLGISVNTKTNKSSIKLDGDFEQDGQKETIKGTLDIESSDTPVEFTKPEGAKPIMEIIGAFSGGLYGNPGGSPVDLDPSSSLNELQL